MSRETCRRSPGSCSSGMILGIGVILLGLVLLLEQVPGVRESRALDLLKHLWPLILVAMGAARMRDRERPARGWVLIGAGLILLAISLGHGSFGALVWPGILLCAGTFIVLHTLRRQRGAPPETGPSEDFLRGTAILSGIKHQVHSLAFQGGELTAIFGGFDLDLRQVVMAGGSARVDVFLLFGGGEIRVPADWEVAIEATTIAGGVSDKGPGLRDQDRVRPRLILNGLILFAGAEVKR